VGEAYARFLAEFMYFSEAPILAQGTEGEVTRMRFFGLMQLNDDSLIAEII